MMHVRKSNSVNTVLPLNLFFVYQTLHSRVNCVFFFFIFLFYYFIIYWTQADCMTTLLLLTLRHAVLH